MLISAKSQPRGKLDGPRHSCWEVGKGICLVNPVSGRVVNVASFCTKLLPPRPTPELLSRPRLTERLLANLSHPLTLVTANAGSGKTTLVADFLRTHDRPFVWYQLDHTDADPWVFLGYLTYGIQQVVPGFGEAMFHTCRNRPTNGPTSRACR